MFGINHYRYLQSGIEWPTCVIQLRLFIQADGFSLSAQINQLWMSNVHWIITALYCSLEILKRSAIQLISPLTWPASWSSIFFNVFQYLFLQVFSCPQQLNRWPCPLLCLTKLTIREFTTLQSDPRDLWPLRHLIRVMIREMLGKLDNSKLGSTQQWMTLTCCQDHILTENI